MPVEFKSERKEGAHVIQLPLSIEGANVGQIETAIKSWLLDDSDLHVLDFSATRTFSPTVYRPFILYAQQLKANAKRMFSIGLTKNLADRLKSDGVYLAFNEVADIQEARKRMNVVKEKSAVNVDVINPFITATQKVLETQASTPIKAGKPYMKKADQQLHVDIAGHIALQSREFTGSVTLCFPATVFLNIYENMVGEKHTELSSDVQDAAGELLNIIFGQAKTLLNDEKGYTLDKALPTILVGDRLRIHHQASSTILVLPFESGAGAFHLEVAIHRD